MNIRTTGILYKTDLCTFLLQSQTYSGEVTIMFMFTHYIQQQYAVLTPLLNKIQLFDVLKVV